MLSSSRLRDTALARLPHHSSSRFSTEPLTTVAGYHHVHYELRFEDFQQVPHQPLIEALPVLGTKSLLIDPCLLTYIDCYWKEGLRDGTRDCASSYQTIDLLLEVSSKPPAVLQPSRENTYPSQDKDFILEQSRTSSPIRHFLNIIQSLRTFKSPANAVLKLILPPAAGYAVRADYLEMRLQDCPRVATVHSFLNPLERCDFLGLKQLHDFSLLDIIKLSAGVVMLKAITATEDIDSSLASLENDLYSRLNIPWIFDDPILSKRVALVRGRPNLRVGGPVYRAVAALGMKLIIIDEENHWLRPDTEENRQHREAFLSTDMTEDSGVLSRIVHALKQYPLPIDGIFTLSDNFLVAVSAVATQLGLPTCPVSAFETSVDKYLSRLLQDDDGTTLMVSSSAELKNPVTTQSENSALFSPRYPMIVKPTKGWSSECVAKVNNKLELLYAVENACERHQGNAVIETYIEGPEIDVNFILCSGEILFVEVVDELPSGGDSKDAAVDDNFSETGLMLPSVLPAQEQTIAVNTLKDMLVELGFLTGIFHVEARITNSSVEYQNVGSSVDLASKGSKPAESPRCRLIEINARPAGFRATLATKHTYGVDYYAAQILAAVGDLDRLKALSQPFQITSTGTGAQYWSRVVYVTTPRSGVVKQEDACKDLKQRCPDLVPFISITHCYYTKGDRVDPVADGASSFFAHLLVFSRLSRQHVMEIAERVHAEFRVEIEE